MDKVQSGGDIFFKFISIVEHANDFFDTVNFEIEEHTCNLIGLRFVSFREFSSDLGNQSSTEDLLLLFFILVLKIFKFGKRSSFRRLSRLLNRLLNRGSGGSNSLLFRLSVRLLDLVTSLSLVLSVLSLTLR